MSTTTSYQNGKLVVTRLFNAPRAAVFDAWIKTSKVELWWGCSYATRVESDIEPEVGGKYSHLMLLKDVGEYRHHGLITAYDPPALLAYELTDALGGKPMQVQVQFTEQGHQTKVVLCQTNLIDAHSKFVLDGWSAGFEKLAALLLKDAFAL